MNALVKTVRRMSGFEQVPPSARNYANEELQHVLDRAQWARENAARFRQIERTAREKAEQFEAIQAAHESIAPRLELASS